MKKIALLEQNNTKPEPLPKSHLEPHRKGKNV